MNRAGLTVNGKGGLYGVEREEPRTDAVNPAHPVGLIWFERSGVMSWS